MKLIVILLTTAILQVSASSFGQSVSLKQNNAKLSSVLDQIRKQTGYDFFYSQAMMENAKPVSVNLNKVDIKEALEICFKNQPLSYTIENKIVTIKEKEKSFLENVIARFQAIDVRGKVVDSLGNGLAGATVSVKGGKGSTSTSANGDFYLKNVDEGATLIVSYLGYMNREEPINKEFNYIILHQSTSKLDEIQVVAYGTTITRISSGSVGTLKSSDIDKQPINNPLYALQGRIAGLIVTPTSGIPGSTVSLQIRGVNTLRNQFNGQADPLIVVDGMPIQDNLFGLGTIGAGLSSLSYLNPNNIESIDILKDAGQTSIYGSRGSNGVVLITTKNGKPGKSKLDFNLQTGIADVPKMVKLLNTPEYLEMRKEAYKNDDIDISSLTPDMFNADLTIWNQDKNTNWQKKLIGKSAFYGDYQATVSGGTNTFQYLLAGNYHRETTVFPGENADNKGSVNVSLVTNSDNQKFKSNFKLNYLMNRSKLPGIDFTSQALSLPPNAPDPYHADGSINWEILPSGGRSWENPYSELAKTSLSKVNNLLSNLNLSYQLLPRLTVSARLGYNQLNGSSFKKISPFLGRMPEAANDPASSSFYNNSAENINIEPLINYKSKISSGDLEILVGASYQASKQYSQSVWATGFVNDALLGNLGSATNTYGNTEEPQYKYAAVFTRISYRWKNKYIVEGAARRDGSSRFGPGKQFGSFGSVAGAWIFSEENFIKDGLSFLSYGKIRTSYGSSGNDGIGDYQYLEKYEPILGVDPYQGIRSYRSMGVFNDKYAWERTKKLDLGIEAGFFNEKLFASINYFNNRADNQLINYPYPTMVGPGDPLANNPALIKNSGIEVLLNGKIFRKTNFTWDVAVNFTRSRNKLISFPNLDKSVYYNQYEIGQPFAGIVRAYQFAGVDPLTGVYQFADIQGNKVADPYDPSRLDGGKYLRLMTAPKYYGGVSNALKYKSLSLDVFVQFTKQLGTNPMMLPVVPPGYNVNMPIEVLSRWQKSGDRDVGVKFSQQDFDIYLKYIDQLKNSNYAFRDASFMRLKNISISYSLPRSWLKNLSLKQPRIFIQGQNLITITNYKGLDPETQNFLSLPPLRVWTLGLNITL